MIKIKLFLLLAVLLSLGCATTPHGVGGNPLQQLTSLGGPQVFAGSSDSSQVAFTRNGLYLLNLETGYRSRLSKNSPIKLSWSPTDKFLAAAFEGENHESRLVQYSSDGQVLVDTVLPITVSKLVWSLRGDLLVVGYSLQVYSFGGNLQQHLYRFNGSEVVKVKLDDVSLKPHTVNFLAGSLSTMLPVHFTAYGDELYYVRLHDPPEFQAYLDVVWKSWQAGEGKTLMTLPLQETKLAQGANEDSVVVAQNNNQSELDVWSRPTNLPAGVPVNYRFSNGRLFDGEQVAADWGKDVRFQLLNGGTYLLAANNLLYLGRGLDFIEKQSYSEKKWNLRRWRASGLINLQEYLDKLKDD